MGERGDRIWLMIAGGSGAIAIVLYAVAWTMNCA
jgi:hypothetical protein